MKESKITLTHRLQREGNWDKASLFKDECIAKLRAEGKHRKEAQQAAWEAMEQRFPPQPSESEVLEALPSEPADHWESVSVDFFGDAMWVYGRLGLPNVKPQDAPSAGAWSLLRWAKRNEDRFFEQILPKVMAKSAKTDSRAEEAKEEQAITTLEQLFSVLQREQEAVSDTA